MKIRIGHLVLKKKSLPLIVMLILGAIGLVVLVITNSIKKNSNDEIATVSLEDTYLKEVNANYSPDINSIKNVAADSPNEVVENKEAIENKNDATENGYSKNTKNAGNNSSKTYTTADESDDDNSDIITDYVPETGSNNVVPVYNDGTSASIAGSSTVAICALDAGFSQLYSNGNEVNNIYYYEENGTYCGEVVTYNNYTIIYIISRTATFDENVRTILTSLVGNYSGVVWSKFIESRKSQSFYLGEEKRLVRIVVPEIGGHYQIVIYN